MSADRDKNIGARIRDIMTDLMGAAVHFLMNRQVHGARRLMKAEIKLAALRVAVRDAMGPQKLPSNMTK